MKIIQTIGNNNLWEREKTLFLTSKRAPYPTYARVFNWVDSLTIDDTVVCFNTSELEAEVVKALLVNRIPTILVVMDYFHDRYNVQINKALEEDRILIMVLKREEADGRGTTPYLRNRFIIGQVQHTVCGYVNTKGSIILVLNNDYDITYLKDDATLLAAEMEMPTRRWSIAEDKRLLSMYYDDMGIHAIHKAINRPYSVVLNKIKSLAMDDESLKGRQFEDYVVELLFNKNNGELTLKEWRGDKSIPGIYPTYNSAPDLVLDFKGMPFAIECKWRSHIPHSIAKDLLPPEKIEAYKKYSQEHNTPTLLVLGIDGSPDNPDYIFLAPITEKITSKIILSNIVKPTEILTQSLYLLSFSTEPKTENRATKKKKQKREIVDSL